MYKFATYIKGKRHFLCIVIKGCAALKCRKTCVFCKNSSEAANNNISLGYDDIITKIFASFKNSSLLSARQSFSVVALFRYELEGGQICPPSLTRHPKSVAKTTIPRHIKESVKLCFVIYF